MRSLRFVPDHAAAGVPNVVVDGPPNPGTVLTLSHWPGSPTPVEVRDDLSAQIAFHALDHPAWFEGIDAVTNNHFDQDGLASAFVLLQPDAAAARRAQVIDVARAGDFGTFESRDAARIAMAIAAHDDPDRSPLPADVLTQPHPQRCGALYEMMLPRFIEVLDHPERWRDLWDEEDAHLGESLDAIANGAVLIDERPDLDLAVVTVPDDWSSRITHRFSQVWTEAVHPMAVNRSTSCLRILLMQGRRYRLELRYESWVMLVSRPALPRPDLRGLAAELDQAEPGLARWQADEPGALTPQLRLLGGESGLAPEQLVTAVERYLTTAPPAWDPFAAR